MTVGFMLSLLQLSWPDPVPCSWDVEQMREHLIHCLESGLMTRFPQLTNKRHVRFTTGVLKSFSFVLYCTCRTINDKSKSMIECCMCQKWYHKKCLLMKRNCIAKFNGNVFIATSLTNLSMYCLRLVFIVSLSSCSTTM